MDKKKMFLENLQKLNSGAHATPSAEVIKKAQEDLTTTFSESFTRDDIDDLEKVKNYTEKKALGLQKSLKKQIKENFSPQKDTSKFMEWFDEFYAEHKRNSNTEKELRETIPKLPAYIEYEEYSQKVVIKITNIIDSVSSGDSGSTDDVEKNTLSENMYDNLLAQGMDFNGKLDKTYTRHYTSVLRDRFHRFWENHHNDNVKYKWGNLSEREKEFFFTEIVLKKLDPRRTGGKHIPEIDQDNNTSLDGFQKAFKEKVSKDFLAYCKRKYADKIMKKSDDKIMVELKDKVSDLEADFKAFIETKLDYDFAKPNPAYAIGLLGDMVQNKYGDKDNDLQKQMNLFLQNMDNGNIIMDPEDPNYNSANPNSISDSDLGDSSLLDAKELKAVVADTEMISEEKALARANEDFKNEYESSAKFGPTRAYLFFFRSNYINKQMKKYMNDSSYSLDTDEETTSAVNRWMLKKSMNLAGADKITEDNNVFNDPAFNADLSRLLNEYCNGTTMTADEFNIQAIELINTEAQNGKAKIDLKDLNISQIGSNLVDIATIEKEQRQLYGELIGAINRFYSGDDDADKLKEFDGKVRELINAFTTKHNRLPDMIKEIQPPLDLNKINFAEKLATHKRSLEKMRMRNIKMKLSMLVNTEALKQPQWYQFLKAKPQDKRGLTTAQHIQTDKLGARSSFYRWMEQHPYLTALGTTAGLVGGGVLGAALSLPGLGVGIGAGTLAVLNYLKKKGHYTKEHVKFEKKLLAMTSQDREVFLKKMQKDAEKRPKFLRAIWPTDFDKYGKSLEFTNKIQSIQRTNNNIKKYLGKKEKLSTDEERALRQYLIEGISALQLQEDIGRNFLQSQQGSQEVEKTFNELHKIIIGGLGRMDPSKDPQQLLQQFQSRISAQGDKTRQRTQYNQNAKDMSNMRTKLGLFAGGKAAGIYLVSAWAFGQVSEAWNAIFGSETASSITSFQLTMDPKLQSSLQSHMDSTFGSAVDLTNMTPKQAAEVQKWLTNNGLTMVGSDIYQVTNGTGVVPPGPTSTILDPALTGANPGSKTVLADIFGGDTTKFDLRQDKIKGLNPSDRSQTLWDSFYDLYGSDKVIATEKTRAFFDYFGEHIVDAGNQELVSLTTRDPLSHRGAEAIANKMTERWSASGMLSSNELNIVTDPVEIKNLFDGFASGTYTLSSLPAGRDIQTAQDALHCKYGGFGYGLKDYIFDYASNGAGGGAGDTTREKVGSLISDVASDGSRKRNARRTTSIGVPTIRNDLMKYTGKIPNTPNQESNDSENNNTTTL